ncbi:2-deoxy-D-gluconate 3-dehydrogenase [Klebsiella grimontii]|uniref:2-deoxy-D-gluconate 3-dehydrogenase n=1 Tax=Klebsiella grimontii TaxID=2058152 RepID=A0A7H4NXF3_9ENTR|nr:2-deoxy-D-gluconate 3-dehydrogenase [Klebsiella grimontii]
MILDAFSLQGKVAVVSGCDTGLGQGMAVGLAEAGCDIVGINIVEPTETIERVTALGRRFLSLTADLRQIDGIPQLLERAVAEFGHIDILVNNAGLIRREDAIEFSEKNWDDVMNLNIKSVFFMSQAAAKHFIAQGTGGKIINIASMLSFQGGIRVPSYTASKSAVMGVTRLLAKRVGEARHQRQRAGAGLYGDQQYPAAARRRTAQQRDPRPYPGGTLGSAERPDGAGSLPGLQRF